jgi:phosphomannomutase
MTIKTLAFDVDGTLTESKSRISTDMISALHRAMFDGLDIVIVTGGRLQQITSQVIDLLTIPPGKTIYTYPTCGARCVVIDHTKTPIELYCNKISFGEKEHILSCLYNAMMFVGFQQPILLDQSHGPRIEDRETQITYSALGQNASLADKQRWDPAGIKRKRLATALNLILNGFEARLGGTTSLDITRIGMDKAYAMRRYMEETGRSKDEILFFGDAIRDGGNDLPVAEMGITSIAVKNPRDCLVQLTDVLNGMNS